MNEESFRSPRFAGWVAGIALAIAVAITPLVVVQYRQYQLLSATTDFKSSMMWSTAQLELEELRLAHALEMMASGVEALDAQALSLRYDIFLSRIAVVKESPDLSALRPSAEYRLAVQMLDAFVTQAEPVMAALAQGQVAPSALRALVPAAQRLQDPLGDLLHLANMDVYGHVDERNRTVRQQSILVIALAGVQGLILLAFVALLVVYNRRQYRQNLELHKLTAHLRAARAEAEAANQGKTVFLANMSHEIRTPFQGLLGMLNLLDESSLSGSQRDYVQTARDSAQHLLGILNDILDVSTMESGTLKLTPTPVHLEEVVSDVYSLMRVAAIDKGLELRLSFEPGLPGWVSVDAMRLRQILFNLINNAIKFTEQGGVFITVRPAGAGAAGVVFTIEDTGGGMDEETQRHLFERFYQADDSVKRRYGGTGLGLEISLTLTRMMGGDITVSSQLGRGSTFRVTLPLVATNELIPPTGPVRLGGDALRILAAEDHPINLKYLSILLEKMGHDAVFCENGEEAVELVRTQPFDVVLMDLHMPIMDGLSATRAIRALPGPGAKVKIILVTADVVNDTREQALQAGVDAFAAKPLQANDLHRALRHCGLLAGGTEMESVMGSQFVVSDYDVPMELPPLPSSAVTEARPLDYVEGPVFREIVAMMPQETLRDLLDELFNSSAGAVQSLQTALADQDRAAVGVAAHKLKGTAMLLGFKAIVRTTAELEHVARKTEDPIDPSAAAQLQQEIAQTREALATLGMPVAPPDRPTGA